MGSKNYLILQNRRAPSGSSAAMDAPSGVNAGSALELFVAQPSLVGFETPSRMLLTAVRELFENALDSVRGGRS